MLEIILNKNNESEWLVRKLKKELDPNVVVCVSDKGHYHYLYVYSDTCFGAVFQDRILNKHVFHVWSKNEAGAGCHHIEFPMYCVNEIRHMDNLGGENKFMSEILHNAWNSSGLVDYEW